MTRARVENALLNTTHPSPDASASEQSGAHNHNRLRLWAPDFAFGESGDGCVHRRRKQSVRWLALLPCLFFATGCITLLPEPPPAPRVFALEAGNVARGEGAPIDAVITVAEPNGEAAILGADLIWRSGDEVATVAHTQWSAEASDALQAMLVETLSRQGRFAGAARSRDARGRYEVRWDVMDFQVDEASMQARFVANVRLNGVGRRIIAQEIITAEAPVSSRSSSQAAQALARAAREGSARIGMFAADRAAQDLATSPPRIAAPSER